MLDVLLLCAGILYFFNREAWSSHQENITIPPTEVSKEEMEVAPKSTELETVDTAEQGSAKGQTEPCVEEMILNDEEESSEERGTSESSEYEESKKTESDRGLKIESDSLGKIDLSGCVDKIQTGVSGSADETKSDLDKIESEGLDGGGETESDLDKTESEGLHGGGETESDLDKIESDDFDKPLHEPASPAKNDQPVKSQLVDCPPGGGKETDNVVLQLLGICQTERNVDKSPRKIQAKVQQRVVQPEGNRANTWDLASCDVVSVIDNEAEFIYRQLILSKAKPSSTEERMTDCSSNAGAPAEDEWPGLVANQAWVNVDPAGITANDITPTDW